MPAMAGELQVAEKQKSFGSCRAGFRLLQKRTYFLLAASLLALTAEAPFDFDRTPGKLPKNVVPEAYRIAITPDLQTLKLTGSETVDVTFRAATNTVVLNQAGLTLQRATLEDGAAAKISADETQQTATLVFPKTVSAGKHTLSIVYDGKLPSTPAGIYYDDYKTPSGAAKRMLVTQFEVADARRMFPGWDEPAFKATFQLTATLPKDFVAVSNMPVAHATDAGPALKRFEFQTSPRMSTYLLALVAGDMAALHGAASGTQMNAYAPSGEQEQAKYALSIEQQVLPYYNMYFGVPFPLPKLDLIAIPGDYEAGAMENWGAITFVDNAMLFDPKTSSPHTRERIYTVVSHEMAHQWSGDLVTMGWWDDIWLNEGFATWMENKAADHFNPAWQIWPRAHTTRERAMGQDAQPTTHPIQQVIKDESQASSAFDQISYEKGEQIIRMIEDWLGPDVFRDGMRRYMKAHQYGNSTSADLWAALSAASHKDVAHVASGFTEQPGIPLVEVARVCEGGKASLTLTQDRFTIHDPHAKRLTWTIPVTIGAPGAKPIRVTLGAAPLAVPIAACGAPEKVNLGEDGYYRTQYDSASLKALTSIFPKLEPADRANVLGDEFALFVAGRAKLTDYFGLLAGLKTERNIAVWEETLPHLRRLDDALAGSPQRAEFDAFAVSLIRPAFARLGWDEKPGESFLDSLLRPQLILALGWYGDADVVAESARRFKAFVKQPDSLPAALRDPVMTIAGHHADQETYDTLKKLGIKATSSEEKLRYFFAMAAATNPALIRQTVAFGATGEVPNGRLAYLLLRASSYSGSPDLLFKLVQPHEDELDKFSPPGGIAPGVLVAAASGSSNPATAQALLADKSSSASTGAHIWALRAADMIETSADLRGRTQEALASWLKGRG
jgi:aminopeptidase N